MKTSFLQTILFVMAVIYTIMADAGEFVSGIQLTGYSASCKYDNYGGPNTSKSGLKPRTHTLDGDSPIVLIAVPQSGGTGGMYGCELEFDFSASNVPAHVREMFAQKKIYAGDVYGAGSNGKKKFDISLECTKEILYFNYKGVKARKVGCGKVPH